MKAALQRSAADSRFQLFLARLFGEPHVAIDGAVAVHGSLWRGHMYILDITNLEKPTEPNPNRDSQE